MLEIVNQLDGFDARGNVKVLMATNRPDTLDPALLRPGRMDRRVEFGVPDLEGRSEILRIHSGNMNCAPEIMFELLARLCPNCTGADLRSVCTEAGMYAIRARRKQITEKDMLDAINKVIKGYAKFSATPKVLFRCAHKRIFTKLPSLTSFATVHGLQLEDMGKWNQPFCSVRPVTAPIIFSFEDTLCFTFMFATIMVHRFNFSALPWSLESWMNAIIHAPLVGIAVGADSRVSPFVARGSGTVQKFNRNRFNRIFHRFNRIFLKTDDCSCDFPEILKDFQSLSTLCSAGAVVDRTERTHLLLRGFPSVTPSTDHTI
jgi:hypothetical protein